MLIKAKNFEKFSTHLSMRKFTPHAHIDSVWT
jgi:hypothetical protein